MSPRRTQVYLPTGHRWASYATGEEVAGGTTVVVDVTSLTVFPVFVRLDALEDPPSTPRHVTGLGRAAKTRGEK